MPKYVPTMSYLKIQYMRLNWHPLVRSHRLFDPGRLQSTPDTNMYDQPYWQVTRRALNILPIRRLRQFTMFFHTSLHSSSKPEPTHTSLRAHCEAKQACFKSNLHYWLIHTSEKSSSRPALAFAYAAAYARQDSAVLMHDLGDHDQCRHGNS